LPLAKKFGRAHYIFIKTVSQQEFWRKQKRSIHQLIEQRMSAVNQGFYVKKIQYSAVLGKSAQNSTTDFSGH
jgi:hypothetical protein